MVQPASVARRGSDGARARARVGAGRRPAAERRDHFVFRALESDGGAVYYLGIIDLLQAWTLGKRLERWSKMVLMCRWGLSSRDGMSAVEPRRYAARFVAMLDRVLEPRSATC